MSSCIHSQGVIQVFFNTFHTADIRSKTWLSKLSKTSPFWKFMNIFRITMWNIFKYYYKHAWYWLINFVEKMFFIKIDIWKNKTVFSVKLMSMCKDIIWSLIHNYTVFLSRLNLGLLFIPTKIILRSIGIV